VVKPPEGPGRAPPVADGAPIRIPKGLRKDFVLKVNVLGGRPGDAGVRRLTEGDTVSLQIQVERDAYVGVWTVAADGTAWQLFPNRFEEDNLFRAGQERTVPRPNVRFVAEATKGEEPERLWVVASASRWDSPEGQQQGPFLLFKTERERKAFTARMRSIRVESGGALAEEVLKYHVAPPR
jgi:hypothetical protein